MGLFGSVVCLLSSVGFFAGVWYYAAKRLGGAGRAVGYGFLTLLLACVVYLIALCVFYLLKLNYTAHTHILVINILWSVSFSTGAACTGCLMLHKALKEDRQRGTALLFGLGFGGILGLITISENFFSGYIKHIQDNGYRWPYEYMTGIPQPVYDLLTYILGMLILFAFSVLLFQGVNRNRSVVYTFAAMALLLLVFLLPVLLLWGSEAASVYLPLLPLGAASACYVWYSMSKGVWMDREKK